MRMCDKNKLKVELTPSETFFVVFYFEKGSERSDLDCYGLNRRSTNSRGAFTNVR